MKKRGYFLGLILATLMLFLPGKVMAECSYEDQVRLASEAANVKVSYEIVEDTSEEDLKKYRYPANDYFVISVFNVTENTRVTITDGIENEDGLLYRGYTEDIAYGDTNNGTYTFEVEAIPKLREFKVSIYSENGQCNSKLERSSNLTLPMYNEYYTSDECKDNKEYYCAKYMSVPFGMAEYNALRGQTSSSTEVPSEPEVSKKSFFEEYWVVILIAVVAVIVIALVARTILAKKKQVI